MRWFRTIPRFVRVLVGLFLVAQFAGVVSSPLATVQAIPNVIASHIHHQHACNKDCAGSAHHHGDQSGQHADYCCALHAFFAGVLPPVITVDTTGVVDERLAANLTDVGAGVDSARLDRPPRPLL